MGDEGTIEVISRQYLNFYPETYTNRATTPELIPQQIKDRKPEQIAVPKNDNKAVQAHVRNWLDAIRGEAQTIAPPRTGQQAAVTGHLANLSFKAQKKILWDEAGQKYSFV